jgi:hypothetical protein
VQASSFTALLYGMGWSDIKRFHAERLRFFLFAFLMKKNPTSMEIEV